MNSIPIQPYSEPEEIERRSLSIIDAEVPEPRPYAGAEWEIVRRLIHTTADFELLSLVRFHPQATEAGLRALASGCTVFTDTRMAKAGIPLRRLDPLGCRVECLLDQVDGERKQGGTRAAAAMRTAGERLAGSVVAIGNAPTALLALLEMLERGLPAPALVVGFPVGFVNAAESKALLVQQTAAPFIAIQGRKGGSPLAAAAVNALAGIALARSAEV